MNDDCLYSILLHVSAMDLCWIGQTCVRLNAISKQLFKAKYKICIFDKTSAKTTVEAIQFFRHFGSLIVDLQIDMWSFDNAVMDAVMQYCTPTLKALKLSAYEVPDKQEKIAEIGKLFQNLQELRIEAVYIDGVDQYSDDDIFTPEGNLINCFNNCQSLVNLQMLECFNLNRVIFESSFPSLHHFETVVYCPYDNSDKLIEGFVLRHQNLKSFSLDSYNGEHYHGHIPALNAVAANCKNLEKLEFGFGSSSDSDNYGLFLRNLSKLPELREIKNFSTVDHASSLVKVLQNHRNKLEVLDLLHVESTAELIPALSQLSKLHFLRFNCCGGVLNDINPLGQLTELTALSIKCLWNPLLKFDLVKLVDRLVNLTRLKFNVHSFKIGNQIYLQLVHAVEKRRKLQNRTLQVDCPTTDDFIDLKLAAVKFIKFE